MLPAVYLAAGEGKRLRPLTGDRPKAMVDIGGVPLAERAHHERARRPSARMLRDTLLLARAGGRRSSTGKPQSRRFRPRLAR